MSYEEFLTTHFAKDALGFWHGVGDYEKHVFVSLSEVWEIYFESRKGII